MRRVDMTLPQLAEHIRFQTAASKMELPWLKLAIFGNQRSEKNSLRTNENVLQITGIEVEHDAGEIAFGTALATILRAGGVRCILYTSPSYVPGVKERWRILLPLSSQLSARGAGEVRRARQRPVRRQARARELHAVAGVSVRQRQQQSQPPRRGDRRQVSRSSRRSLCRVDLQGRQQGWRISGAGHDFNGAGPQHRSRKDDDPEPVDPGKIEAALNVISSDCNYKTVWMPIGGALHYALGEAGFELFDRWSAKATGIAEDGTPRYTPARNAGRAGAASAHSGSITTATIFHFADQADPAWRQRYDDEERQRAFARMAAGAGASSGAGTSGAGPEPAAQETRQAEPVRQAQALHRHSRR